MSLIKLGLKHCGCSHRCTPVATPNIDALDGMKQRVVVVPLVLRMSAYVWRHMATFLSGHEEARVRSVCALWNGHSRQSVRVSDLQQLDNGTRLLPMRLCPLQRQHFRDWMEGVHVGRGGEVGQPRPMAFSGVSITIRLFCLALACVDASPKWRLRIIISPGLRNMASWLRSMVNLGSSHQNWGKLDVSLTPKQLHATDKARQFTVLTVTHVPTQRSRQILVGHHRLDRKGVGMDDMIAGGPILPGDFLLFEGRCLAAEEHQTLLSIIGDQRVSFYAATERFVDATSATTGSTQETKVEAPVTQAGVVCGCTCLMCDRDGPRPGPPWRCVCTICPKDMSFPLVVRVNMARSV